MQVARAYCNWVGRGSRNLQGDHLFSFGVLNLLGAHRQQFKRGGGVWRGSCTDSSNTFHLLLMKLFHSFVSRRVQTIGVACSVLMSFVVSEATAAPPANADRSTALERLGKALFGSPRKARQVTPRQARTVTQRGQVIYERSNAASVAPPITMTAAAPVNRVVEVEREFVFQDGATLSRGRLVLPVPPAGVPRALPAEEGFAMEVAPVVMPPSAASEPAPTVVKPLPPVPDHPPYAIPAGSRGYVRLPGAAVTDPMIDVRDLSPGQKFRDPKSGEVFLVPPF